MTDGATGRVQKFAFVGTAVPAGANEEEVLFDLVGGGLFSASVQLPAEIKMHQ